MGDFTYITDANFIDEKAKKIIQGTEILVLNALRKEKHLSHFTLTEAIEMATVLDPRQTYFTHIKLFQKSFRREFTWLTMDSNFM